MKHVILLFSLVAGLFGYSQTIVSASFDDSNSCKYDYKLLTVVVDNIAGGSLSVPSSSDNGHLALGTNWNSDQGSPTTTFTLWVQANNVNVDANDVSTDSFEVTVLDVAGAPTSETFLIENLIINGEVLPTLDLNGDTFCANGTPFDVNQCIDF
jgi:hypothetical protein